MATNSQVSSLDLKEIRAEIKPRSEREPGQARPHMATNSQVPRHVYGDLFNECWRLYGRKEEKDNAYAQWKLSAKLEGGEQALRDLVVIALQWQGPIWAADGWKFAKYFGRYLKYKRWNDERPPEKPITPIQKLETFEARRERERQDAAERESERMIWGSR